MKLICGVDPLRLYLSYRLLNIFEEFRQIELPLNLQIDITHRRTLTLNGTGGAFRIAVKGPEHSENPKDYIKVEHMMMHEMCHVCLPGDEHGLKFRKLLLAACVERWPEVQYQVYLPTDDGGHENLAYAMDEEILQLRYRRREKALSAANALMSLSSVRIGRK